MIYIWTRLNYTYSKPLHEVKHDECNKPSIQQAEGSGFINQAQKDSPIDNNYKFSKYSLQLYAIVAII